MAIVDDLSQGSVATYGREGKTEVARSAEQIGEIQKMENRGNEAKNSLKTKENGFFNAANYAHFARKTAQIEH